MKNWLHSLMAALSFVGVAAFGEAVQAQEAPHALDAALNARWNTVDVPAVEGTRLFVSEKTVELALSFGYQPNDDYANVMPLMFDVVWHITSEWGVGLRGSVLGIHTDTALKTFLDAHQPNLDSAMLYEQQNGDISVFGTYRPVYGKWTAGATNLGAFDWGITAGLGAVFVKAPNADHTKTEHTAHFQGLLGMDAHVFFLDWLALRLEASIRLYQGNDRFMAPCFLGAGISFYVPVARKEDA